jgi:DNA-binding NtrC family response regulator
MASEEELPASPRSVLIADPRSAAQRLVCQLLQSAGYRTRVHADGRSLLRSGDLESASAVFTYLLLPEGDAFEGLRACRARGISTPVFVIVPCDSLWHGIAEGTRHLGAAGLLFEPFSIELFFKTITPALAETVQPSQ